MVLLTRLDTWPLIALETDIVKLNAAIVHYQSRQLGQTSSVEVMQLVLRHFGKQTGTSI